MLDMKYILLTTWCQVLMQRCLTRRIINITAIFYFYFKLTGDKVPLVKMTDRVVSVISLKMIAGFRHLQKNN